MKDLTKRRASSVDEEEKVDEESDSSSGSLVKIEYRFSKDYTHAEYIITFDESVGNVPKELICRFSQIKRLHESLCGEFIHVRDILRKKKLADVALNYNYISGTRASSVWNDFFLYMGHKTYDQDVS